MPVRLYIRMNNLLVCYSSSLEYFIVLFFSATNIQAALQKKRNSTLSLPMISSKWRYISTLIISAYMIQKSFTGSELTLAS